MTFNQAFASAIAEEMDRDPTIFILGEDIGKHWGGSIGEFRDLGDRLDSEKVIQTPVSEVAIVGAAIGAAEVGMRPVAYLMFCEFMGVCMSEIMNAMCKSRYMTGGRVKMPVTLVAHCGAGVGAAGEHSSSIEGMLSSIVGLKIVLPSTPYDVKGLLKAAIREDNPVLYLHHKLLVLDGVKSDIPDEEYIIPLGKADIKREGSDVTVVATAAMVHRALSAAAKLQENGISIEVVDPRTIVPLDKQTIIDSVEKTGRLVVMTEEPRTGSVGAMVSAIVAEEAFDLLDAPIRRISAPDAPVPFSPVLEKVWLPNEDDLIKAVTEID